MILGLTGAFGGGKSTVLHYFAERNWSVFDADKECHLLYSPENSALLDAIREIFGAGVFGEDALPDRKKMAQLGFRDRSLLDKLSRVLYPMLTEKMLKLISRCQESRTNGIFELPLLYEGGFEKYFEAILAVWTDPGLRAERLTGRGFDAAEMSRRDAGQLSPQIKLENADFAVINNGSPENLCRQLELLAVKWESK